ncbi:M1 family metallopeptidase [Chryseolinea sp. H1M3-3]|uniref:M1 family metallopeptidase n=1 Tax=Chryseolinea sp. H1M3-3 TaxID=3034144 RepID=UPI0023ED7607|nr:M1 family metallopeptidase [Chryseolinea sp. H1M3-3]
MFRITILVFASLQCFAQTQLPIATNFKNSYLTHVRAMNGLPGKNYWQNRANYSIRVRFSPDTRQVSGHVDIEYLNDSPDTLSKIIFKLYPNLYKTESVRTKPISKEDLGNGVEIDSIFINGRFVNSSAISIRGTNMTLGGVTVLPQTKTSIKVKYSYILNQGSFIRTGQVDDGAFVVAYFFPRVTVYDDIDGWNEYPYTGFDEFYNDYGNFHVEITVPGDYQVWCTGNLANANDVLNEKYVQLIQTASNSERIVDVITKDDISSKDICRKGKHHTWIFDAANVQDVAFMTSNHYIWKSSSVLVDSVANKRVRVDAVYNPDHVQYDSVIKYARGTVSSMSYIFPKIPFPYPHITIFEGLDAMEYPMMVNNLPFEDPQQIVEFTAHEVFHTLFPFYVGTNETKYSFLDEGLATLSEFTLHPIIAPEVPMHYDISDVNQTAGTDYDNPVVTLTPQLHRKSRFSNKDLKPALGFHYVKEMLGDEKFSEALRFFIDNWKGKHPSPYDFFNCLNTGSRTDLNWFWNDWFFSKISPDLAIKSVSKKRHNYIITIQKIGIGMVPIHLTIFFEDGTQQSYKNDISCWSKGNDVYTIKMRSNGSIKKIALGNDFDVDIDKSNNVWTETREN